jgi:Abnormal spindle-like microcephaly-assoc'd, ASPM-SPD-2-Hydin
MLLILSCGLFSALSGCGGTVVVTQSTGTFGASPSTIVFGNVTVGKTSNGTVTFKSGDSGPVQITQLSVSGQGFALSGQAALPITVPAGGTFDLDVQFSPVATGAATGQITVASTSSTNSTVVIALSGTGTSATATAALSALSCVSASIVGSGTDSCTVALSTAAGGSGMTVNLSSNNSAVTVPASVTVAAGATSATFTATASSVTTATAVTLGASAGGINETFALHLNATVPTLGFSTTSVAFGNVALNTPTTRTVVLSSNGTASVTVNSAALTGSGFTISGATFPVTLAPGQTATLSVKFDPTAAGAATGQLTITSNSSTNGSEAIALSGTGTSASATAALTALSCTSGSIAGSRTDACTVTLNTAAPASGFSVSLSSNNNAVTIPASVTVAAGATSANFTATVSAVTTAQAVKLEASAGSVTETFALQLSASVPALSIGASSIGFGNVALNTPATQTVILSSTGTASVTVNSAVLVGVGFTLSGPTFPETLSPGQTATLGVEFDPTVLGAAAGTLTITSTSSTNGTAVIAVTGTGTAASYAVDLSWDAPTNSTDPVAGYNVYRSPSGGSTYALLNSSVDTLTTYVDSTVQNGDSYDYIVESVDASGVESVPTSPVVVTIP